MPKPGASTKSESTEAAPPGPFGRGGPGGRFVGKIEKPRDTRGVVRRLWGYLKKQRVALVLAGIMIAAGSALDLVGPYLLSQAIDKHMMVHDLPGLKRIVLLMMAAYASSALLSWLQSYVMASASLHTVRDLREHLFEKLQSLPLEYFDRTPHGDTMSRFTNDVDNVSQVLSGSIAQIVSGLIGMVGAALAMLFLNPLLAVVSVSVTVLLTLTFNSWISKQIRAQFRDQQASLGKLNGLIEETVTGQRVLKAFHREPVVIAEFDSGNADLKRAASKAQSYSGVVGPLMNTSSNLSLAIIAGIGGMLAVRGAATVGMIAAFINYSRQFGWPLNNIANLYNSIQSAMAGAERVFDVIDMTPEIDALDAKPLPLIKGDVTFDNVSFSYVEGVPVLKNVSLHAKPGDTIALVGPTGAGKTTIVNLLTRFYEIDHGAIAIDGRDIKTIRKDDLRRQLGIVLQDTVLFAGTVWDNIRYGRLDATDAEVIDAAKLANADPFIRRLAHGYDTVLSERAGNLSQGQRQLIAIARAVLANPSILILDEATSSVDTRTEKHIQDAMLRLRTGRTSFVIAHRLSTIREARQIIVISGGEMVERGTHDELLSQGGFYRRMYANQLAGLEE
ncbi:MAG TPA: ABC transporter ATP-binding protein [Capsulimonadaceae bacterium]|jgi:ATP-binding cassette subfamily B protein